MRGVYAEFGRPPFPDWLEAVLKRRPEADASNQKWRAYYDEYLSPSEALEKGNHPMTDQQGDDALRFALDFLSFTDRHDTDDIDFGIGIAQSGLIDRARKLVNANAARAGVTEA